MHVTPSTEDDSPQPAAPKPRGEVTFNPELLDQLIEGWYREHIHNSVVSRTTEIVNHVRASVDDLKRRLGIGGSA